MKKKLLTMILCCALAFSATACGSSAESGSSKETTETETRTPIEEAVASTKTIGEINREATAAENPVEEPVELPEETLETTSDVPVIPEITAELAEVEDSDDTSSDSLHTLSATFENTDTSSSFQDSMGGDLLSSLTGDMSSGAALTELPENFSFTLPEGFYETEDGVYMNNDESNPAYISCFALATEGYTSDTSLDAADGEVNAYFEALADEMETEFYNSYGVNVNVSVLETESCQVDENDGYTIALQYDISDYGFTMLQFVGVIETQDYVYFYHCMEVLGTNYYDEFKACFNSINIE